MRTPIVLDPAHGGHQPSGKSSPYGARGPSGSLEKDLTLALCSLTAQALGGQAALTRWDDRAVPLSERLATGSRAQPEIYASVHIKGPGRPRGPAVWVHDDADAVTVQHALHIARSLGVADVRHAALAGIAPSRLPGVTTAVLIELDGLQDAAAEQGALSELQGTAGRLARALSRSSTTTLPPVLDRKLLVDKRQLAASIGPLITKLNAGPKRIRAARKLGPALTAMDELTTTAAALTRALGLSTEALPANERAELKRGAVLLRAEEQQVRKGAKSARTLSRHSASSIGGRARRIAMAGALVIEVGAAIALAVGHAHTSNAVGVVGAGMVALGKFARAICYLYLAASGTDEGIWVNRIVGACLTLESFGSLMGGDGLGLAAAAIKTVRDVLFWLKEQIERRLPRWKRLAAFVSYALSATEAALLGISAATHVDGTSMGRIATAIVAAMKLLRIVLANGYRKLRGRPVPELQRPLLADVELQSVVQGF